MPFVQNIVYTFAVVIIKIKVICKGYSFLSF